MSAPHWLDDHCMVVALACGPDVYGEWWKTTIFHAAVDWASWAWNHWAWTEGMLEAYGKKAALARSRVINRSGRCRRPTGWTTTAWWWPWRAGPTFTASGGRRPPSTRRSIGPAGPGTTGPGRRGCWRRTARRRHSLVAVSLTDQDDVGAPLVGRPLHGGGLGVRARRLRRVVEDDHLPRGGRLGQLGLEPLGLD